MARVLIVGCGRRGRTLAGTLADAGYAVRGTTRDEESLAAIRSAGAEAARADPDRLSTLLPHIDGISALCWLMGTARGEPKAVEPLHGSRLESIATKLIDTHVRGLVYEAAGSVGSERLAEGAAIVRRVGQENRMPVEVVDHDPGDVDGWTEAMTAGIERVLSG